MHAHVTASIDRVHGSFGGLYLAEVGALTICSIFIRWFGLSQRRLRWRHKMRFTQMHKKDLTPKPTRIYLTDPRSSAGDGTSTCTRVHLHHRPHFAVPNHVYSLTKSHSFFTIGKLFDGEGWRREEGTTVLAAQHQRWYALLHVAI
jgi:hypothetical protein